MCVCVASNFLYSEGCSERHWISWIFNHGSVRGRWCTLKFSAWCVSTRVGLTHWKHSQAEGYCETILGSIASYSFVAKVQVASERRSSTWFFRCWATALVSSSEVKHSKATYTQRTNLRAWVCIYVTLRDSMYSRSTPTAHG